MLTLRGDHYSMGWQHGRQVCTLRPLIAQAMRARFEQIKADNPDKRFENLLNETGELLQEVNAPLVEMIRGQAKALEFEFDMLLRYNLVSYLRDDLLTRRLSSNSTEDISGREGCTTWAASGAATSDGTSILVKNRDYLEQHLPLQIVVHAAPENGYCYIYVSSAGSPGVFCGGINQAGLAVTDTHVTSTDLGPGLPDYALMMHILEKHNSVAEAVDYLRSVPLLGRNNIIMADAQGNLAVFEIGHSRHELFETQTGILVNTNHFVSPELKDCFVDLSPPQNKGNTFHRYKKVTTQLNAAVGKIDVPFAQGLMAAHDGPLASICRHPVEGSDSATISNTIFLPVQRKMLFCHGLPCQEEYIELGIKRDESSHHIDLTQTNYP